MEWLMKREETLEGVGRDEPSIANDRGAETSEIVLSLGLLRW